MIARRDIFAFSVASAAVAVAGRANACSPALYGRGATAHQESVVSEIFSDWFIRSREGFDRQIMMARDPETKRIIDGPREFYSEEEKLAAARSLALFDKHFTDTNSYFKISSQVFYENVAVVDCTLVPKGGVEADCTGLPSSELFFVEFSGSSIREIKFIHKRTSPNGSTVVRSTIG